MLLLEGRLRRRALRRRGLRRLGRGRCGRHAERAARGGQQLVRGAHVAEQVLEEVGRGRDVGAPVRLQVLQVLGRVLGRGGAAGLHFAGRRGRRRLVRGHEHGLDGEVELAEHAPVPALHGAHLLLQRGLPLGRHLADLLVDVLLGAVARHVHVPGLAVRHLAGGVGGAGLVVRVRVRVGAVGVVHDSGGGLAVARTGPRGVPLLPLLPLLRLGACVRDVRGVLLVHAVLLGELLRLVVSGGGSCGAPVRLKLL